jgi:hypothetical protein
MRHALLWYRGSYAVIFFSGKLGNCSSLSLTVITAIVFSYSLLLPHLTCDIVDDTRIANTAFLCILRAMYTEVNAYGAGRVRPSARSSAQQSLDGNITPHGAHRSSHFFLIPTWRTDELVIWKRR